MAFSFSVKKDLFPSEIIFLNSMISSYTFMVLLFTFKFFIFMKFGLSMFSRDPPLHFFPDGYFISQ